MAKGCRTTGGPCEPTVLVDALGVTPSAFTLTDTHLYFVNEYRIARVPVGGGDVQVLVESETRVAAEAVDAANVYFTTATAEGGVVARAPLDGSGTVTVLDSGHQSTYDIEVADGFVYYSDDREAGVYALPTTGGTPTRLAALSQASIVEPYGDYLYFQGQAQDATAGSLSRVPRAGGSVEPLCAAKNPGTLALNDQGLFWYNPSSISHVALGGGTAVPVVAAGEYEPTAAVAVDETGLYYGRTNGGVTQLVRSDLDGSDPVVLFELAAVRAFVSVRVNDTTAFVGSSADQRIYAVNKCGCP